MKFGYFSAKKKEYVITNPETPTPWINYLNNGKYCALISNTAGGYSFYQDPKSQRILRYRYNNIPVDRPGRYFYIRDNLSGIYWSPTWQPVGKNLDHYECHHGLGYTVINSEYDLIESNVLYFVPINDDIEIWRLNLKNKSNSEKDLTVFTYAEFCLWDAVKDQRDLQYIQNVAICDYIPQQNSINFQLAAKDLAPVAFFGTNEKIDGFDCDREKFIGLYRSESNPLVVEEGRCSNSKAIGGNPIASFQKNIKLKPMETKEITVILGVTKPNEIEPMKIINKYRTQDDIYRALGILKENWTVYLSKFHIETSNPEFDMIVNIWNQYQCKITFDWARYASYYETGIGRGIGFRDCFQDTISVCHSVPLKVRERILKLCAIQFEDGHVYHNYFPLSDSGAFPNYLNPRLQFFGDDHLWMILGVSNYLKETGDLTLLEENVRFVEGSFGTLYDHMKRAINFTNNNMGPHGFPLIGTADWNDTLQLHGPNNAGESVMVAMQFHLALLEMVEIAKIMGKKEDSVFFNQLAKKIFNHVNEHAWDGNWYIRGFTDNGKVIGSDLNKSGKIYLNTQTWAVISKIALEDRAERCLNAVKKNLVTDFGIKLLNPPYTHFDPNLNGITTFPPGLKENAAIFCHTNPWAIIAECMINRAETAWDYYTRISPATKNNMAEIHQTEPYIFSQMITGNDHPNFGAAKNSWLTGTASWTLHAATAWILGIRPSYDCMVIDPCIPSTWDKVKIQRVFRNTKYQIEILNPSHVSKGIKEIAIDGKKYSSNRIPILTSSMVHKVQIIMGKP